MAIPEFVSAKGWRHLLHNQSSLLLKGARLFKRGVLCVILSIFIAGLIVGRIPESMGKKVAAYDVKMAMLTMLIFPITILVFTAISSV